MDTLHVLKRDGGEPLQGLPAIETLFGVVGFGWAVKLATLPPVGFVASLMYKLISSNRLKLGGDSAVGAGIMALGRYFAGPVIHKLNPIGVLFLSAIITTVAIFMMSKVDGQMLYVASVLFALGVCYFWPTMIGFVSEYLPKTGALGMSLVGGAGMLATGIWQPVIGSWIDENTQNALDSGLTQDLAELAAGKATLGNITYFPLILVVFFGILYLNRKKLEKIRYKNA